MYLAYIDESYNKRQHWVAAVLVEHTRVDDTHRALRAIVKDAGLPNDAELHGHELFHGRPPFDSLEPRQRVGIYAHALRCLSQCDARLILRGVNVPNLHARYTDPGLQQAQRWAVEHLIERIDEFCAPNEHALLVADEHDLSSVLLDDLRHFKERSTRGYRARTIRNVVDTIHFVPSRTNALVQAADLVVFLYRRISSHEESDPRAVRANAALWSIVQSCVAHAWIWHP